ncbi:MAG: hypothetical protein IJR02_11750 [Bacteroidaceae bacterium]|nr:hypothetical protein [Bacteroidaceae bacterium]
MKYIKHFIQIIIRKFIAKGFFHKNILPHYFFSNGNIEKELSNLKEVDISYVEDREKLPLYDKLLSVCETNNRYKIEDLGEGMAVVSEVIREYWKPRWLINHDTRCVYEFMNQQEKLVTVTYDDIAWEMLTHLPDEALMQAKTLDFHFPSFIYKFENGVAEVKWQLNPDGYYYMDEDGYGMTDDKAIDIYGFIDKEGKVVVKFQNIANYKERDLYIRQREKK